MENISYKSGAMIPMGNYTMLYVRSAYKIQFFLTFIAIYYTICNGTYNKHRCEDKKKYI